MMSAKEQISIDLSSPLTGTQHGSTQLLQQDARQRIENLLSEFKQQNQKYGNPSYDEFDPIRVNHTIFIDGERGAGKTTFLRAILKKYQDASELNVCPLPLIDPTLIETHQHILIDIVTKFVRQLDKKIKCCQDEKQYHQFREKLDVMAEGLKLISQKESTAKEPSDASWFLEKALNKATNGQDLERHFHQLLDTMADMLKIDLFLIAIDDVDTQTEKADEVLEVLRCYLTHPKLVVVLSGDLKLYSHIVRNNKRKELKEQQNSEKSDALIGHLEQQYLAKILPVEQRIQLKKLDELSQKYDIQIVHNKLSHVKQVEIRDCVKDIFSKALYFRQEHLKSHLDFLLSQPVRSVLQLLKTMLDASEIGSDNNPKYDPLTLKNAIYQSFIGDLVSENLKLENLSQVKPHISAIGGELFKILRQRGELETGFYARPDSSYDNSGYNAAKIYLSATIASIFNQNSSSKNISQAIKMILSGGIASNIYQTYVANNLADQKTFVDYLDYVGLSRNEDGMHSFSAHISPIVLHDKSHENKSIYSGILRTTRYMDEKKSSFNEHINHYNINNNKRIKTLAALEKKSSAPQLNKTKANTIAMITILASSHSAITSREGRDYISSYSLLATIADILESGEIGIQKSTTLKNYIYPSFLNGDIKGEEDWTEGDLEDSDSDSTIDDFMIEIIENWRTANDYENHIPRFSSLLLGKIATRINYSLNQVSEKAKLKLKYNNNEESNDIVVGVAFARFVWAIINSSLIEELRYSKNTEQNSLKSLQKAQNTITSPTELIKNINSVKSNDFNWKKTTPLTYCLITCPLLWPFLGEYIDGNGNIKSDLFDIVFSVIKSEENELYAKSFEDIAKNSNPSTLDISALAIIGCFKKG